MSNYEPHLPPEVPAVTLESEDTERRAYILARIKTAEGGNPTIAEARALGVPESELKDYAFLFLEKDIRAGYGLDTVRSIAEQSGVVSRAEIDELFVRVKAEMSVENTPVLSAEEIKREEAAWLAEMLELCGESK